MQCILRWSWQVILQQIGQRAEWNGRSLADSSEESVSASKCVDSEKFNMLSWYGFSRLLAAAGCNKEHSPGHLNVRQDRVWTLTRIASERWPGQHLNADQDSIWMLTKTASECSPGQHLNLNVHQDSIWTFTRTASDLFLCSANCRTGGKDRNTEPRSLDKVADISQIRTISCWGFFFFWIFFLRVPTEQLLA